MRSSVVDEKADQPKDGSTVRLTRCWADESHGTTARIKQFNRRATAAHLLGWLLWMRIKHSHRKIIMNRTQTTCPNRIAIYAEKKGRILLWFAP